MQLVCDLHIHSRFSRAVSSSMNIPTIAKWAKKKGIDIVGSGDWTHPLWFRELQANLYEDSNGLYKVNSEGDDSVFVVLSTEISSIYSQYDKTRKVHTLILSPNLKTCEEINKKLNLRGINLLSDGRPIVKLSAREIAEIAFEVNQDCMVIPAHIWTPHFSMFGAVSGFDSIEDCFAEFTNNIHAIETGLSSDPAMNWKIEELEKRSIISSSDAHSPAKLGREATVIQTDQSPSYAILKKAIENPSESCKIEYTIEFYPEEGKYHFTGHRKCNVFYSPRQARKFGYLCPVCGKPLTIGVASRVEQLGKINTEVETKVDANGLRWMIDKRGLKPPYTMIVPLQTIIAQAFGMGSASKKVTNEYEKLTSRLGSEFDILLRTPLDSISEVSGDRVAEAIKRARCGDIYIKPGYDGVFGEVSVFKNPQKEEFETMVNQGQLF